jgi:hypothetical protein
VPYLSAKYFIGAGYPLAPVPLISIVNSVVSVSHFVFRHVERRKPWWQKQSIVGLVFYKCLSPFGFIVLNLPGKVMGSRSLKIAVLK